MTKQTQVRSTEEAPAQTDWEAVAADQAMTIALLKVEQPAQQQEPVECANGCRGFFKHHPPAQRKPLTVDEVWKNDELMSLNAGLGCSMDLLMEVVEAVEAAHGIYAPTELKGDA